MLFQPELSSKARKTSEALFLGQRIKIGMRTMKKPIKWPMRQTFSILGSQGAPKVLKRIVRRVKASIRRLDQKVSNMYWKRWWTATHKICQFVKVKFAFVTSIIDWTCPATMKLPLVVVASQPRVDIQPEA